MAQLDRSRVRMRPLAERCNKQQIESVRVSPDQKPTPLPAASIEVLQETAARIRAARAAGRPVIMAFGAHAIKNGLGPVLAALLQRGWLTHLATNGAGIIHDWEFAFQGASCEDVRHYVARGEFGNWHETGYYLNLALNVGAWLDRGYGESVGAMICESGLQIPSVDELAAQAKLLVSSTPRRAAAAADLLYIIQRFKLAPGFLELSHPYRQDSVQAAAFAAGVPLTGHPMFGHDIIYTSPMNCGAAVGRTAERDFLRFAKAVSDIEGGVYLSVGSAVMSPMVFEKSFSMAQNLALQAGAAINGHYILVADLAVSRWDWRQGEPPEDNPDYYLRYNKTFSRMGGTMRYLRIDNRDLLLWLAHELGGATEP